MAPGADTETRQTYLVEHYRPGVSAEGLKRGAAQIRAAVEELEREGIAVRYLNATIVPADESFLCVLESASEELVREAYTRAQLAFERISTVIPEEREPAQSATPKEEG
jgi:Protein of unknown function (DUF4242)